MCMKLPPSEILMVLYVENEALTAKLETSAYDISIGPAEFNTNCSHFYYFKLWHVVNGASVGTIKIYSNIRNFVLT